MSSWRAHPAARKPSYAAGALLPASFDPLADRTRPQLGAAAVAVGCPPKLDLTLACSNRYTTDRRPSRAIQEPQPPAPRSAVEEGAFVRIRQKEIRKRRKREEERLKARSHAARSKVTATTPARPRTRRKAAE